MLDDVEAIEFKVEGYVSRFSWVVRVIGDGTDKSHYLIVRVCEEPGTQAEMLTLRTRRRRPNALKFPRNGWTVWCYRQQAREEKKAKHPWKTNYNSWSSQQQDAYPDYYA